MISYLEQNNLGKKLVQYKLRDWLFSRQRYWGEPFPIYVENNQLKAIPYNELPVTLPEVANYEPNEKGEAPLANNKSWVQYKNGHRITDTMPGAAGSSWYFFRYTDPNNQTEPFSKEKAHYWMPVDLYVGGPEHTVGHLLYSRFWTKVLFDVGLSPVNEPFKKLAHQGMILGPDGEKMSKSRGNVIPADDVAKEYGVDTLRCYVCFLGPLDKDKPWSSQGIDGVKRFLDRFMRLVINDQTLEVNFNNDQPSENLIKLLHKSIKKITEDIESLSFNTCISQMMILINEMYKENCKSSVILKPLVQLLQPFAPHIAEELWSHLKGDGLVVNATWPSYDPTKCIDDTVTMGVQVNGKMRGTIELPIDADETSAVKLAMSLSTVSAAVGSQPPLKIIYKAGKILNIIVK